MRICFWNTNKNKDVNDIIVDIICENRIDLFVLAEYNANPETLKSKLYNCGIIFEEALTAGCKRITIVGKKYDIVPGFQNTYCSLQIINKTYLLGCVHLPSKSYADADKRGIVIHRIIEEIQRCEEKYGIEKTVLVGDMNENPYESGSLAANRFHGIPVYTEAAKQYRIVMDERFKMFYNPMWNLMGDFSFPPGTYYYSGNEVNNSFWNIYDQVMIRPCLRDCFADDELRILDSTEHVKLIDKNSHPSKKISDHLPIIFEIKESCNEV